MKIFTILIGIIAAAAGVSGQQPTRCGAAVDTGNQSVNLQLSDLSAVVNFELTYARKDNPK